MYKRFGKRFLDFMVALISIIILSPMFLIITILLIKKGKPFFIQQRPGKGGDIFDIIKFKTMNENCNPDGILLPDEKRLTKIGKLIRKTSLDEIPQFINVIKGDMSIIGPRPLLTEYLPLYNDFQQQRHKVKPGITGWAQINGRNAITWQQKFEYDIWYIDNMSFLLDIKIIIITMKKIFKKEGISPTSSGTMDKFKGTKV